MDDNVVVCSQKTDDDIVADIVNVENNQEEEENEEEDENIDEIVVTKKDAEKAVDILYHFFESSENADACNLNIFESIYEIEKNIRKVDNCKQTKITNYFKPL